MPEVYEEETTETLPPEVEHPPMEVKPEPQPPTVPTSAANWRGQTASTRLVTLPSGNVVKIRNSINMMGLLKAGRIPNHLMTTVRKMMSVNDQVQLDKAVDADFVIEMHALMDLIAVLSLVEPRCVRPPEKLPKETDEEYYIRLDDWVPPEGAISLSYLEMGDKQYIFALAQGGVEEVQPFRPESSESVAPTQDGGAVSDEAINTTGDTE